MNYKLLFLGIFLGIILSILIYCIYTYIYLPNTKWYKSNVGVTKNHLLDGALSIPITKYNLTKSSANRFSIELWLFINPTGSSRNIFTIGSISLDLYNDTSLKVTVKDSGNSTHTKIITPSFSLQKWQQVIISIDQYLLDLYLDGKLMQSIYISNSSPIVIPDVNNDDLKFTKSDIYVSGYNLKTSAINTKTALENYKIGKSKVNGTTNVSLALSKNNNVSNKYNLF